MHPDYFKMNPFPARPEDVMEDDNPPMSLNEEHMIERQRAEQQRLKSSLSGLLSIFK